MNSEPGSLKALIQARLPLLGGTTVEQIVVFSRLLNEENERQNLTRLTSPPDFVDGHLEDVIQLLATGFVEYPALDMGSGGGVPGLLAALLGAGPWILSDSEKRKAEFLETARSALGLSNVSVVADRAENYLVTRSCNSIVARAVGPMERIAGWLEKCSTWNTLVLLKGPKWEEEWKDLEQGRHRGRFRILGEHRYEVGPEKKKRVIVRLENVPRGTT